MSDIPEIQALGQDFSEVDRRIATARAMIALAKDAGEDTSEWEAKMRELIIKKDKWANALKKRGVSVTEG